MKGIYLRNFLFTVLIVFLSFLILTAAFFGISYSFTRSDKKSTLSATSAVIAYTTSAKLAETSLDDWDLRMMISTIAKSSDVNIAICDKSGFVVSCSDEELYCKHLGAVIPSYVTSEIDMTGEYVGTSSLDGYYDSSMYISAVAIENPDTSLTAGYALVAVDYNTALNAWRPFVTIFFFTALTVLAVTLLASFITTGREVAPLKEMAVAADKFAHGDFSVRVGTTGRRDEIGELADSFNQMADALEQSEKQRSEFVANISHELKTPMTTISGFADGILDGTIPPEKQKQYLEIITSETKRLARLVRRMLDVSRVQALDISKLNKTPFNVTETAAQTLISLEGKINEKKLDVATEFPEEPLMVQGEEDAITQVIYNLLDNAIKFSDAGGQISLSIWKQGKEKAYVSVKDIGAEISSEDLPMIFDRFYKSDSSRSKDREGVGLGLYIAKAIINSHGGEIYANSRNGETEFVFTLPLSK